MDILSKRAKGLAEQDFAPHPRDLPEALDQMNYQQYRLINFRPEAALWKGEALFEVQFFHPGFLYKEPVTVRVLDKDGTNTRFAFDPEYFLYRNEAAPLANETPPNLGYAGFRVHYPMNSPEYKDEFVVFQGASYFRLVGPGQVYGLSARGIAVDTAEPSGEEFPSFREFWLVKPEQNQTSMVIFALLDSPSVTGAYRFELLPGYPTSMDVEAQLFARKDIRKLGVAPLTSMFFYGENRVEFVDDFRPEIHDSDGLLMRTTDQWIWRPLQNPRNLQVTSLLAENPDGFGLMQRDRKFDSYLDPEAKYHHRPSFWVDFQGDWGKGRVELVEIPTNSETNDNVVAYWVPEAPFKAGEARNYKYRLQSFDAHVTQNDLAKVVRTHNGWAALPGQDDPPPRRVRRFVVDFQGGQLQYLHKAVPLEPRVEVVNGAASNVVLSRLPEELGWRVTFELTPNGSEPVDMRLHVGLADQRLSEVWSYVWSPDDVK